MRASIFVELELDSHPSSLHSVLFWDDDELKTETGTNDPKTEAAGAGDAP